MLVLSKRSNLLDIAFLLVIYVLSVVIVNPLGNFPLLDDWSYARAVQGLVERGDWRPTGWTGMSLITQSLWGAIFCVPAGFSFNALRFSTLTLAIVAIISVYLLFVINNRRRLLAVLAAVTFGFNPIYFELSNTFMTDVPFTALAMLSSIFYVRCIRRFRSLDLLIGCALSLAATLCRQIGLFLPLAFAIALVIQRVMQRSFSIRWFLRAILPSVLCATALVLFEQWMRNTGRMPAQYGMFGENRSMSIKAIASRTDAALLYLGLFCLPILLLNSGNRRMTTNSTILRAIPTLSAGLFALLSSYFTFGPHKRWMPLIGNTLIPQGLGPLTIPGSYEQLPFPFWGFITVLSVVGGALLVRAMTGSSVMLLQKMTISDTSEEDIIKIFFLIAIGIYAFPILVGGLFDRYLVPLVPFLLYLDADGLPHDGVGSTVRRFASVALIVLTATFSVVGTRDYLTWNRIRWQVLAKFQQISSLNALDINGGFEYTGWFLYDPAYRKPSDRPEWRVDDDKYMIAFSKIPGFIVIKAYGYSTWMPPKARLLFLLERDGAN